MEQNLTFAELGLSKEILQALEQKGYGYPTRIQAEAIPPFMQWKDVIAKAPTGTGKTFAFGIPMLEHIDAGSEDLQGLVLAPTRELAIQICDELKGLAAFNKDIRVAVVYGGAKIEQQIKQLAKHPQIVVATPGRLMDHYNRKTLRLDKVQTVVLDEADRMLDMGFIADIRRLLPLLPVRRQTLLFSATMPRDIVALSGSVLRDPVRVEVTPASSTVDRVDQRVYFVERPEKKSLLVSVLRKQADKSVLVFSRTKHGADNIARMLKKAGIRSEAIHGNKSQGQRQRALGDFKSGKVKVMVATDIAARGIDVSELHTVINYDLPDAAETYVHRIGRTGRAGRSGVALTFCSQDEHAKVRDIQKLTGRKLETVSCTA